MDRLHLVVGQDLLAREGINGTIAGPRGGIDAVLAHIRSLPGCAQAGTVAELWEQSLGLSYGTELRSEGGGRAAELLSLSAGLDRGIGAGVGHLTCGILHRAGQNR